MFLCCVFFVGQEVTPRRWTLVSEGAADQIDKEQYNAYYDIDVHMSPFCLIEPLFPIRRAG